MKRRWFVPFLAMFSWISDVVADPAAFEPEIRKFEVVDQRTPPPAGAILFTGSSSIRFWTNLTADFPDRVVLNRGFGGSQMSDLLHFFDRVVAPYQPKLIVVYEGDNDIAAGKSADEVLSDHKKFIRLTQERLPGTPIAFLATKPSPSRRKLLPVQMEFNRRLRALAAAYPWLSYIDVATPLLDASGEPRPELYRDDRLHLNGAGYAIWREVVGKALADRP